MDTRLIVPLLRPISNRMCGRIKPNVITVFNLVNLFGMVFSIYTRQLWVGLVFVFFRICLDSLDGMVARTCHQTSTCGAWLDEVTDFWMLTLLLALMFRPSMNVLLFIWTALAALILTFISQKIELSVKRKVHRALADYSLFTTVLLYFLSYLLFNYV